MKQTAMAAAAEFTWSNAALQYEAVFQELGVKDVLNGPLADPRAGSVALDSWMVMDSALIERLD